MPMRSVSYAVVNTLGSPSGGGQGYAAAKPHLPLPPGELSPQVTERVFQPSAIGDCFASARLPSPSSLRSDTSPKGRSKAVQRRSILLGSPFGRAVTAGD